METNCFRYNQIKYKKINTFNEFQTGLEIIKHSSEDKQILKKLDNIGRRYW